jgi:hypothetical protein
MYPFTQLMHLHKKPLLRLGFLFLLLLSLITAFAQKKVITYNFYLKHTVRANETFNAIGALYGISGETLAAYNNLEYYEGDIYPKYLTVPLTSNNFSKSQTSTDNRSLVPVYLYSR